MRPRWAVRCFAWVVAFLTLPALRRLSVWLERRALLFRHVAPGRLLQRAVLGFVRMEASCCRADSPSSSSFTAGAVTWPSSS